MNFANCNFASWGDFINFAKVEIGKVVVSGNLYMHKNFTAYHN